MKALLLLIRVFISLVRHVSDGCFVISPIISNTNENNMEDKGGKNLDKKKFHFQLGKLLEQPYGCLQSFHLYFVYSTNMTSQELIAS